MMTKLQSAAGSISDGVTLTGSDTKIGVKIRDRPLSPARGQPFGRPVESSETCVDSRSSDDECDDNYDEPLGYQDFLYDVNIEYSPGGNRSGPLGNKYCFKMKCLPYMVVCNNNGLSRDQSIDGSSSDITNCDREEVSGLNISVNQIIDLGNSTNSMGIDVTRETCAFLGNSDFVPSFKNKTRKVTLELVSAKLSQSSGYHIPPNSSLSNLTTLAENQAGILGNPESSSLCSYNSHSSTGVMSNQDSRNPTNAIAHPKIAPPPSPSSPSSSKKFVNYTILIKTTPGLDKHPAIIERRFSDFLSLYQGLKNEKAYANIIEKYVMFPKKVYMGNFSLEKIAARSIEFNRLLSVCMTNINLTWSVPFISFLIDKELKEAHRLSLFGDPDDVQTLIENAYYVEQKLYFKSESQSRSTSSTCSLDLSSCHSPALPNGRSSSSAPLNQSRSNQTISEAQSSSQPQQPHQPDQDAHRTTHNHDSTNGSSPDSSSSTHEANNTSETASFDRDILTPINQRILVTFCMLFVTYCRSQNHQGLKQAVGDFSQLISSQKYVDSLIMTRHYNSLRACLLFLMNLNHSDVVDDNLRMLLKRKLEDIDGIQAELGAKIDNTMFSSRGPNSSSSPQSRRFSLRDESSSSSSSPTPPSVRGGRRVTKKDLTSLLRDRDFCSFQDGRFGSG